jgi:bisphosphoglycerate-dependent phosphoglycerate mutase
MASTLVYCVRHGQTAENLRGIIQGQLDTLLDETGIEQAAAVARALKDITFNAGWSSDLARAVDVSCLNALCAEAILNYDIGQPDDVDYRRNLAKSSWSRTMQNRTPTRKSAFPALLDDIQR